MLEVPLSDFRRMPRGYRELVQNMPLALTSRGRIVGYFISPSDFEQLQDLRKSRPQSFATAELSEADINEIASGRMSSSHAALDDLLDAPISVVEEGD